MKKLIDYLVARYNKKNPTGRIRVIPAAPPLLTLREELAMYNSLVNSEHRIVDVSKFKEMMHLINEHNRYADETVEIVKPTMYRMTKTSTLDVKNLMDKEPRLLENIIAEKTYDMRHAITNRVWNSQGFDVVKELKDNELKLTVTLNVYNDGKDDELTDDGVLDLEKDNGDSGNRS